MFAVGPELIWLALQSCVNVRTSLMVGIGHQCDKTFSVRLETPRVLFTSRYDGGGGFFINSMFGVFGSDFTSARKLRRGFFWCLSKYWPLVICQEFKPQAYRLPQDSFDLLYSLQLYGKFGKVLWVKGRNDFSVSCQWDLWFLCEAADLQKGLWSDDVAQGQRKEAWETMMKYYFVDLCFD